MVICLGVPCRREPLEPCEPLEPLNLGNLPIDDFICTGVINFKWFKWFKRFKRFKI
jgi:hypothetical protein